MLTVLKKARTLELSGGQKLWRQFKPYWHNTGSWQMDRLLLTANDASIRGIASQHQTSSLKMFVTIIDNIDW